MIILDASVLIAYFSANDAHHERAVALMANEIDDEFAVNLMTLAEILVAPTRMGKADAVLSILDDLEVATLQFPPDSAILLARLRAETMLKMPDCCVLLSARDQRARVASFDERVIRAARDIGIVVVADS